ncbi:MAG: DMT family transporter, partial [Candidatus Altiarchaeota archaeon]|nr:DMT family transporter [Candidatus Altiarchaeota archaeon]
MEDKPNNFVKTLKSNKVRNLLKIASPALLIVFGSSLVNALDPVTIVTIVLLYLFGAELMKILSAGVLILIGYFVESNPCVYAAAGGHCHYTIANSVVEVAVNPQIRALNQLEMSMFVTFYIVAIILIGIYIIFMSGSPQGRSRAKDIFVRLFVGMLLVSVSPMLFQTILDFANSANSMLLSTAWIEFFTGNHTFQWGAGQLLKYCCIYIVGQVIMIVAIITAAMRYLVVYATACIFPLAVFLYFFDFPNPLFSIRSLGRTMIKASMIAILTQTIQCACLAITIILLSFNLNNTMMEFLLIIGGMIGICFSPMIAMQLMPWLGAMVYVASTRPSTAGSRFIASMMLGYGVARSLETSSGQTMVGRNMGEFSTAGGPKAPEGGILPYGFPGAGGFDTHGSDSSLSPHPSDRTMGSGYGGTFGRGGAVVNTPSGMGRTASPASSGGTEGQGSPGASQGTGTSVTGGGGPVAAAPTAEVPPSMMAGMTPQQMDSMRGSAQPIVGAGGRQPPAAVDSGEMGESFGGQTGGGQVTPRQGQVYDDRQQVKNELNLGGGGGIGGPSSATTSLPGSVAREPSSVIPGGTVEMTSGGGVSGAAAPSSGGMGGGGWGDDSESRKQQRELNELRNKSVKEGQQLNEQEARKLNELSAEELRRMNISSPGGVVDAANRARDSLDRKTPEFTAKRLPGIAKGVEEMDAENVKRGGKPMTPEQKTEEILKGIHQADGEKEKLSRGPAQNNIREMDGFPHPETAYESIMKVAGGNPVDRAKFAKSGQVNTIVNNAKRYMGEGNTQDHAIERATKPYQIKDAYVRAREEAGKAEFDKLSPEDQKYLVDKKHEQVYGGAKPAGAAAPAAAKPSKAGDKPVMQPAVELTEQQREGQEFQQRLKAAQEAHKESSRILEGLNSPEGSEANAKAREWLAKQIRSTGNEKITADDMKGVRYETVMTPEYSRYMDETAMPVRLPGVLVVPDQKWTGGLGGEQSFQTRIGVKKAGGMNMSGFIFSEDSPLRATGLQIVAEGQKAALHEDLHQIDTIVSRRSGADKLISEIHSFRGDIYSGKRTWSNVEKSLTGRYVNDYMPNASEREKDAAREQVRTALKTARRMDETVGKDATSHILLHSRTLDEFNRNYSKLSDADLREVAGRRTPVTSGPSGAPTAPSEKAPAAPTAATSSPDEVWSSLNSHNRRVFLADTVWNSLAPEQQARYVQDYARENNYSEEQVRDMGYVYEVREKALDDHSKINKGEYTRTKGYFADKEFDDKMVAEAKRIAHKELVGVAGSAAPMPSTIKQAAPEAEAAAE